MILPVLLGFAVAILNREFWAQMQAAQAQYIPSFLLRNVLSHIGSHVLHHKDVFLLYFQQGTNAICNFFRLCSYLPLLSIRPQFPFPEAENQSFIYHLIQHTVGGSCRD